MFCPRQVFPPSASTHLQLWQVSVLPGYLKGKPLHHGVLYGVHILKGLLLLGGNQILVLLGQYLLELRQGLQVVQGGRVSTIISFLNLLTSTQMELRHRKQQQEGTPIKGVPWCPFRLQGWLFP